MLRSGLAYQIMLDFWAELFISLSDKHFVEKFVTEVLLGLKVIDKSSYKLLTLRNMLIPRKWLHTHHSTTNISHYSF